MLVNSACSNLCEIHILSQRTCPTTSLAAILAGSLGGDFHVYLVIFSPLCTGSSSDPIHSEHKAPTNTYFYTYRVSNYTRHRHQVNFFFAFIPLKFKATTVLKMLNICIIMVTFFCCCCCLSSYTCVLQEQCINHY